MCELQNTFNFNVLYVLLLNKAKKNKAIAFCVVNHTVRSYCLSRDPPKVMHATQNSAFKNHPRDILRDKNHFYEIILVHLA